MDRRDFLRAGGACAVGALGALAGCADLAAPVERDAEAAWHAPFAAARVLGRDDGVLWVGGSRGLVALDPASGETTWQLFPETSSNTLDGDTVFAVDNATGGLRTRAVAAPDDVRWSARGRFWTADTGRAYLRPATDDGGHTAIRAVDRASGTERWTYTTEHFDFLTAHVGDGGGGNVYAVGSSVEGPASEVMTVGVTRLDPGTGRERWHREVTAGVYPRPALRNGTLYLGGARPDTANARPAVAALGADGAVRWRRPVDADRVVPLWLHGATLVVATRTEGRPSALRGLDAASGEVCWRVDGLGVGTDGGLVYCFDGGDVVAVDAATGAERHRFDVAGRLPEPYPNRRLAGPRVALDEGALYAWSRNELVALDPGDGSLRWRFRGEGLASLAGVARGTAYVEDQRRLNAIPLG